MEMCLAEDSVLNFAGKPKILESIGKTVYVQQKELNSNI